MRVIAGAGARALPATLFAFLVASCSGSGGEDGNAPARRAVLASVGARAVLPTYRAFRDAASSLQGATATHAASLEGADLQAARDAWAAAMEEWQKAELMQFGPAGPRTTPGGEEMRADIYSWPTVSPCRVDIETVAETYEDEALLAAEPVDVRGLDALEYLLFQEETTNACPLTVDINASGAWADLGDEEVLRRRARYAEAVAALVAAKASDLVEAWEPSGGDFLGALAGAGEGSPVYATSQDALNAVSDALWYLDTETKDMKVGQPAGIANCLQETCPEALESKFARRSKEHVVGNLQGFALVFRGGPDGDPESEGFDGLLMRLGSDAEALAADMNAAIDAAFLETGGVEGSFYDALASDPQPVRDVHAAVKGVTDLLKTQFMALLDLEAPQRGAADND
jgi:uncharacterized protein